MLLCCTLLWDLVDCCGTLTKVLNYNATHVFPWDRLNQGLHETQIYLAISIRSHLPVNINCSIQLAAISTTETSTEIYLRKQDGQCNAILEYCTVFVSISDHFVKPMRIWFQRKNIIYSRSTRSIGEVITMNCLKFSAAQCKMIPIHLWRETKTKLLFYNCSKIENIESVVVGIE